MTFSGVKVKWPPFGLSKGHEWKKLADSFPVASAFFQEQAMNFLGPLRMTSSPAPWRMVFPASIHYDSKTKFSTTLGVKAAWWSMIVFYIRPCHDLIWHCLEIWRMWLQLSLKKTQRKMIFQISQFWGFTYCETIYNLNKHVCVCVGMFLFFKSCVSRGLSTNICTSKRDVPETKKCQDLHMGSCRILSFTKVSS